MVNEYYECKNPNQELTGGNYLWQKQRVRDYLTLLFSHSSFSVKNNRFSILTGVMITTKLENEVNELEKVTTGKDSMYYTKQHTRDYKQTKSN